MKKNIFAVLTLIFIICGGADAAQVGIPSGWNIPQHGHSGAQDGGVIALPSASIRLSSDTAITPSCGNSMTIPFDQVFVDSMSWYNNTTFKFTPKTAGYYLVNLTFCGYGTLTTTVLSSYIRKNGTSLPQNYTQLSTSTGLTTAPSCINKSVIIQMNGTTDYIDFSGFVNGSGTCTLSNFSAATINMLTR